jgi:hypothetical protein
MNNWKEKIEKIRMDVAIKTVLEDPSLLSKLFQRNPIWNSSSQEVRGRALQGMMKPELSIRNTLRFYARRENQ